VTVSNENNENICASVHAQRGWHFTESDGAVSNAILRLAFLV
jgi:hypothetical protein